MNKADKYYIDNLKNILENGSYDENPRPKYKDGTPAFSKFITGVFEEYNIDKGEFPIPTLRNTALKTGIREMFWIYQLQSNKLSDAHDLKIFWWDDWNIGDGTIGNRYGYTVKKYNLINNLLNDLKYIPFTRRHIMNLYQYEDLNTSDGLNPCAYETLWSCRRINGDIYLDLTLIQRSNDFLTAGFINKTQYVALQMIIAGHLGYKIGKFCHYIHNLHIYDRHFDAANELLNKIPFDDEFPYFELTSNKNFYDYTIDDFKFYNLDKIKKIESSLEIAI
jgi:thymidylate synthase